MCGVCRYYLTLFYHVLINKSIRKWSKSATSTSRTIAVPCPCARPPAIYTCIIPDYRRWLHRAMGEIAHTAKKLCGWCPPGRPTGILLCQIFEAVKWVNFLHVGIVRSQNVYKKYDYVFVQVIKDVLISVQKYSKLWRPGSYWTHWGSLQHSPRSSWI